MANEKDQRESERFAVTASSACTFLSPVLEDFPPVKLKNVSSNGVGLVTSKSVPVGIQLVVKLANSAKNFTKTVLVRVVHVTAQPGNTYLVGATLDTPLTYEELCMLVM